MMKSNTSYLWLWPLFLLLMSVFTLPPSFAQENLSDGHASRESIFAKKAQQFYEDGLEYYKAADYEKARLKFLMVEALVENYKSTSQFLKRIDGHLEYEVKTRGDLQEKALEDKQQEDQDLKKRMARIEERLQRERDREAREKEKEKKLRLKQEKEDGIRKEKEDKRLKKQKIREERLAVKKAAQEKRRIEKEERQALKRKQKEAIRQTKLEEKQKMEAETQKLADDHKKNVEEIKMRLLLSAETLKENEQIEPEKTVEPLKIPAKKVPKEVAKSALKDIVGKVPEIEVVAEKPKQTPLAEAQEDSLEKEERIAKKREKILNREQRKKQKEVMRKANKMYRELSGGYKAGRFDFARDRIAELTEIIEDPVLSSAYQKKMEERIVVAQERLARYEGQEESEKLQTKVKQQEGTEAPDVNAKEDARQARIHKKEKLKQQKLREKEARRQAKAKKQAEREKKKLAVIEAKKKKEEDLLRQEEEEQALIVKVPDSVRKYSHGKDLLVRKNKLKKQRVRLKQKLAKGVARLYKGAVDLYQQGFLDMAEDLFIEVDKLWPDYKKTREYLSEIEKTTGLNAAGEIVDPQKKKTVLDAMDDFEYMYSK